MPCETPVPDRGDGGQTTGELQSTGSELLAARSKANVTASEGDVGDEATGAGGRTISIKDHISDHHRYIPVLHENTNNSLLGRARGWHLHFLLSVRVQEKESVKTSHLDIDVLQMGSLGRLPVDTSCDIVLSIFSVFGLHTRQVQDEVADAPIELVLIDVPLRAATARLVDIVVNQRDAGEVGESLDRRAVVVVANKDREVVLHDWRADQVGARRKEDGGIQGGSAAAVSTTT